jgi:Ca2+-binding RTX toxin-like protein
MAGTTVFGGGRADLLRGESLEDTIFGGGAAALQDDLGDTAYGGAGDDVIFGENGDDRLFGERGDDAISGGGGDDTASGGLGNDTIRGDGGADQLLGDEGDDVLYGASAQDDTLDLADSLYGGSGNDAIFGGPGNDVVVGGPGTDALNGGAGSDTFLFGQTTARRYDAADRRAYTAVELDSTTRLGAAADSVFGFGAEDRIDLAGIDADARGWFEANASADEGFAFVGAARFTAVGQVRAYTWEGDTYVEATTNTDLSPDLTIVLVGYAGPIGPENIVL